MNCMTVYLYNSESFTYIVLLVAVIVAIDCIALRHYRDTSTRLTGGALLVSISRLIALAFGYDRNTKEGFDRLSSNHHIFKVNI